MMKRTLIQAPIVVEPPQRKTLLRTNCKSHGKVCKVVIDSSSTENLIFKEMVDKFNLERIPHPNPSHTSWLTKGQQTLINEQAWVDFQIKYYKDRVICDIVAMHICHLILGHPW